MNNFAKTISYIFKLIKETPKTLNIIAGNVLSGFLVFIGLPMLLPALNLMEGNKLNTDNDNFIYLYLEKIYKILNIDFVFFNVVLVSILLIILSYIVVILIELYQKKIQINIKQKNMIKAIELYKSVKWSWLLEDSSGKFHSIVNREIEHSSEANLNSLRFISFIMQCFIYFGIAIFISFKITLLASIFFSIIILFNIFFSKFINSISSQYNNLFIKLSQFNSNLILNKKFFKTTGTNSNYIQKIKSNILTLNKTNFLLTIFTEALRSTTSIASFIFLGTIFLLYDYLNFDFSSLLILILVFMRLAPQIQNLIAVYVKLNEVIPYHISVNNRLKELSQSKEIFGSLKFNFDKSIQAENIYFYYTENIDTLKNISFTINPKQTTAFVGRSGSGKSTLLDLILFLNKPKKGNIFYDHTPQVDIDFNDFRTNVAYVSQDTSLIEGTIYENLLISQNYLSKEKLDFILKTTLLYDFIYNLKDGINTLVGENGIQLSGGQKQRISIARALVTNPKILILDEATSNLDLDSEKHIINTLQNLHNNLTIIIVTHRINSIGFADNIYYLEDGKIIDQGNYDYLFKNNKNFKSLATPK